MGTGTGYIGDACEISPDTMHYVARGKLGNGCNKNDSNNCQTSLLSNDEIHAVRCCTDTYIEGWTVSTNTNCERDSLWTKSKIGGICLESNWTDAYQFCKASGSRLCTLEEAEEDCMKGTGCQFDNRSV